MARADKGRGDRRTWRARAAACRVITTSISDPAMREKMLSLAADCERRADKAGRTLGMKAREVEPGQSYPSTAFDKFDVH